MFCGLCRDLVYHLPLVTGGIFIEVENMPLDFVLIRASSIPEMVNDPNSTLKAGITGSDIIWEAGMTERRKSLPPRNDLKQFLSADNRDFGEERPLYFLNPNTKRASLYIGVTQSFARAIREEKDRKVVVEDLEEEMVATKYERIASEVFAEREILGVSFLKASGTDEAMQYVFPNCPGILGITSSGKSVEVNQIEILEILHQVTVHMIKAGDKLTRRDTEILYDIRSRINTFIQEKKHDV